MPARNLDHLDWDDTPPASPIHAYRKLSHHQNSNISWRLRRSRLLPLSFLAIPALIYYFFFSSHQQFFRPKHAPSLLYKNVEWRQYAYSQYATDSHYLCNSLMIFEALSRLGSRAERILLYPEEWDTEITNSTDRDSQLLMKAKEWYEVKLIPVQVKKFERDTEEPTGLVDETGWDSSITKFLAFNQTQYSRIIHMDSDATLYQHMDDLFLLPWAPVAMMRAYWSLPEKKALTSMFILLEPNVVETKRLMDLAEADAGRKGKFDMEILNDAYVDSALVLPHRPYGLLSGEFRKDNHTSYLGNSYEKWNPARALREAKMVHFSDWPIPKPWVMWPRNLLMEKMPQCEVNPGTKEESGCEDRDIWIELYNDFRRRRKTICGLLSVPAPEWPPKQRPAPSSGALANGTNGDGVGDAVT